MSSAPFIVLVSNISLLIAMVFVYDMVTAHPFNLKTRVRPAMIGLGLGVIGVAVMEIPWVFEPGIIFDTRSVLICISGLFFGFVPTVIVMVMTAAYRILEGGVAAFTGVCVIIASGLIGLVWRRVLKRPLVTLTWRDLMSLGYAVHIAMLALMFTLPWPTAVHVLSHITLPVLTIYPLGTAAIGGLMVNRLRHEQASDTLKRSEMQFRALSEQAAIGVTKTETATGKYVFVNQRFADIVGYTRDKLLTMDFHQLTDPDDLADDLDNVGRLVKSELHEYSMEKRYQRKDGKSIWVNLTVSPLWEEGESPQYLIGLIEDISERRNIASALAASRAALLEAQTIAHIGDWSMDVATRSFVWSDELYIIHGIQPGTPMAHSAYLELIHPEDRKRVLDAMQSGMAGRAQEFTVDYRIIRPDQVERFLTLTGKTVSNDGTLTGLRGTMQDITERKRAEAAKEAMQAQLLQSQKMEAIGQLAGGVAHDFNNLLTGILGSVALVRDALSPSDPLRENLSLAEAAARQAADLTRGLLTFSRSAVIAPTPVCINDAVETALAMLRQSLPATIDIRRQFEPVAWNVLMDQSQTTQIILNLGINARDAMDGKGTITVTTRNVIIDSDHVRTHPDAHAGEHVLLRVSDTGPGLAPEALEHIFEPFFTTKPEGQGTGLGLAIVYGAVTQAGGWITPESPPGLGATFDIYLPRSLDVVTKQRPTSVPPSQPRHGGTILVVEDEPVVATVVQSLLMRSGCTVALARNGAQALETLSQRHGEIDLILLDMTMPGMSTQEIVRGIRSLDAHVPILLTSGYTSSEVVTALLNEGMVQGFLGKPYDLHQLLESVLPLLPH
ncbi:MAG: PAS domain S-box protein [Caldisericia bacterium]